MAIATPRHEGTLADLERPCCIIKLRIENQKHLLDVVLLQQALAPLVFCCALQFLVDLLVKSGRFPELEEIVISRCTGYLMESLYGMYGVEYVRFEH